MGGGAIRVDGVSFGYPGRARVLAGVSVDVAPGTVLALVGPSGAGKTTVAKLLLCLAEPTVGRITVGGVDRWQGHEGGCVSRSRGSVSIRSIRQSTRTTFPSTIGARVPNAMDATAPAV